MKTMTAQNLVIAEKQIDSGRKRIEKLLDTDEDQKIKDKLEIVNEMLLESLTVLELTLNEAGFSLKG